MDSEERLLRALDIFCGGGGSSYGARAAGAEIVCGIDMDSTATSIYSHNFPDAVVKTERLEEINNLNALKDEIGDIHLLLASPECTNHTCAKGAKPRCEASRETAMQASRFARVFKPKWIVLENVVQMEAWGKYNALKRELTDIGYRFPDRDYKFYASDFGVPQKRRRLYLVGGLERQPPEIEPPLFSSRKTVGDILDRPGSWRTTLLFKNGRAKATLERAKRGFAELGEDTPFLIVYYGSDGSGGWQRLDEPLRTITTVDRFALVEPSVDGHRMRMLQVPELRRAMGFGEDFELNEGTRRDKVRILGNGVCPPVMEKIVAELKRYN